MAGQFAFGRFAIWCQSVSDSLFGQEVVYDVVVVRVGILDEDYKVGGVLMMNTRARHVFGQLAIALLLSNPPSMLNYLIGYMAR